MKNINQILIVVLHSYVTNQYASIATYSLNKETAQPNIESLVLLQCNKDMGCQVQILLNVKFKSNVYQTCSKAELKCSKMNEKYNIYPIKIIWYIKCPLYMILLFALTMHIPS